MYLFLSYFIVVLFAIKQVLVADQLPKLQDFSVLAMDQLSPLDPTSFSRPELHIIRHINFKINVDFERKVLSGCVVLSIEKLQECNEVILDVSGLNIRKISLNGAILKYTIGESVPEIGAKLSIDIPSIIEPCFELSIEYETSSNASALQWLDPPQTAGRKHPYLFSQCQAIHARSIYPCQDTPAVKFTYTAEVTASEEFTVLMSAIRKGSTSEPNGIKKHSFEQTVPISSYLLAIAVGVLESRTLGPRTTVWAEKEIVDASAYEFAETPQMLKIAEELCGPYVWGIYDLLILPPSFPYGGMENPCLSFITPTLLAGDRSLADVIVHEITHSWTGNLVTNRNFEHFWLNEGFTVFVERKISSRLYGESPKETKFRDFSTILGLAELKETVVNHLGVDNPLTKLVVNLKGLNPDDAFSTVPYEKGSTFLRYLENLLGGPDAFEPFLRAYLNEFQRKSIDTNDFKTFLLKYFKDNPKINDIEWDSWLFTPGMPLHIPKYDTTMSEACTNLANRWATCRNDFTSFKKEDIALLTSMQQRQFLSEMLDREVTLGMVKAMQDIYGLNSTKNSEVKFRWLRMCIKARWAEKVDAALQFVNDQGRMKYVRPIYRDLYAWEEMRQRTIDNFLENMKYMMHLSVYTIKKDLHLD